LVIIIVFSPSNANFANEMHDPSDDNEWKKPKDDKLWAQEVSWGRKYLQQKFKCPCNFCQGRSRPRMITNVGEHLIRFGWHPTFQVWREPSPIDKFDEKWVTNAWRGMQRRVM
jgi:hypothetical protein